MNQNQLASLLLRLFSGGELERFVRHEFGTNFWRMLRNRGSKEAAFKLAEELLLQHRVTPELFDKLAENRPADKELIEQVKHEILQELAEQPGASVAAPHTIRLDLAKSEEQRQWRESMRAVLEQSVAEEAEPPHTWIEAAAVLARFYPATINPIPSDAGQQKAALERMASSCEIRTDGSWELNLDPRKAAIRRLWSEGRIAEALDANPDDTSPHTEILRRIAIERWIDVKTISDFEQLLAANDIVDWFEQTGYQPLDRDRLASLLQRRRHIEPLRKLIGVHFRGRGKELERLRQHARPKGSEGPRILALSGIGGVGKSALLGKLLMERDEAEGMTKPWVYLDFDNPEVDPTDPRGLIEVIARHLDLLYNTRDLSVDGFAGLESLAAGDRSLSFTLDMPEVSEQSDASTAFYRMLEALDDALLRLPVEPSLLLVLDTFEQVQVRGTRTLMVLRDFINRVLEQLPYAQIVISGRAEVHLGSDVDILVLDKLDEESADSVLGALGVGSEQLRRRVIDQLGTNPLSLRLAAEAIVTGSISDSDIEELVLETQQLNLQGQLYTRILGHISDLSVRQLAHPGLIVRRVTPAVIRDVLAGVCRLDPDRSDELFDRLPDFVSLFEPDEHAADERAALRHRQDVRETMLKLMMDDPLWQEQIAAIHEAAIRHYQGRGDPIAQAEELYHRLMRNEEPAELDPLWDSGMVPALSRCWAEPLPPRSRQWLGLRLGLLAPDAEAMRTIDWEITAHREASAHLETGDPAGALEILRQRTERTAGSELNRLEVQALWWCDRSSEAVALLTPAIESAVAAGKLREVLKLHLLGADIAVDQNDSAGLAGHVERAIKLAVQLNDRGATLRALQYRVIADQRVGDADALQASQRSLEYAFYTMDDATLRKESDTARQVVQTIGPHSKNVLMKAAITFGNRAEQNVLNVDAFQLEEMLSRISGTEEGRIKLKQLASEVGLSGDKFELIDLAGQTIRYGRMGDAIAAVVDQAGDNSDVRQQATSMFKTL